MKLIRVYDLPLRLFHLFFAVLSIAILFIAKVLGDDSGLFPYHKLLGFILGLASILRLLWGIIGSRWSRFSSFELHPISLWTYFKDLIVSKTRLYMGHNPASSWATLMMLGCVFSLVCTGYLMAIGMDSHFIEEVHEVCANLFMVTIFVHVLGIFIHFLRHNNFVGWSMVTGKKEMDREESGITSSYVWVGLVFIFLMGLFSFTVFTRYDSTSQTLILFGQSLQIGGEEHGGHGDHEDSWD